MRRFLIVPIALALAAMIESSATAVINWQFVKASGFSLSNPATLSDGNRIRFSSMVADDNGNIYAVCNNGENGTYSYPNPATGGAPSYTPIAPTYNDAQGGVTIFKRDGTKIDIKLTDFVDAAWDDYWWGPDHPKGIPPYYYTGRTDNKIVGAVTKLVKAGDGKIYALLNWLEINWDFPRQNQRIVRINPNGTVESIWSPKMNYTYYGTNPPLTGYGSGAMDIRWGSGNYVWTEDPVWTNKIRGIAVGGDGNVYWIMNGASSYWKYHFLWRYNVVTGEVEEAPRNPGTNEGMSETHRMFGLEYVGNDYFAVFGARQDGSSAKWDCDPMTWTTPRQWIGSNGSDPGWGRDWRTAYAFDPGANDRPPRLWVAGRGAGSGPWSAQINGGSFSIVDLGGGNKGIRAASNASNPGAKTYYTRSVPRPNGVRQMTLAARFRVDSASSDYNGSILVVIPDSNSNGQPGVRVSVTCDPATQQWKLYDVSDPGSPVALATLGSVSQGSFNTVYLYAKDKEDPSDSVRVVCWWNGAKVYDSAESAMQPNTVKTGAYVDFGVKCDWPWITQTGSATITFDWVAYAEQMVSPSDQWPGTPLAGFMDGGIFPDTYQTTNIMSRFVGYNDELGRRLFDTATGQIATTEAFHVNGNDPQSSGIPNGGIYWVNTIAINPDDGFGWMGWSAEAGYSYPDRGNVMVRGVNQWELYDAGTPEPGADVVALTFYKPDANTTEAYALTCNRTTGSYKLYKATSTTSNPFDYNQYIPLSLVRFHRRGVMFTTNTPKVVTYVNDLDRFFYVEEVDENGIPVAGIKVIAGNEGLTLPSVGDAVSVTGYLDVVNGEAAIRAFGISLPVAGTLPPPLTMQCKAVGGDSAGAQPALPPVNGPSNVGLLVCIVGRVVAKDPVNEFSPEWFTVDDGTGGVSYYLDGNGNLQSVPGVKVKLFNAPVNVGDFVSVVGVSSVDALIYQPDPLTRQLKGIQRCLLSRDASDIIIY